MAIMDTATTMMTTTTMRTTGLQLVVCVVGYRTYSTVWTILVQLDDSYTIRHLSYPITQEYFKLDDDRADICSSYENIANYHIKLMGHSRGAHLIAFAIFQNFLNKIRKIFNDAAINILDPHCNQDTFL
jgi:hypothetical protein